MPTTTILAIDDEADILAFYRKLLAPQQLGDFDILGRSASETQRGLLCRTYDDPEQLVSEFKQEVASGQHFPLCIVDMHMKEGQQDGLATARQLREIDPDIDIVFCTAFSDVRPEELRASLRERVFYVRKPFNPDEFSMMMHSLVQYWRIRQELKREAAFLLQLLDSVPDLVFMKDAHGVYMSCNEAFCQFLGRPRDQVNGFTDDDLYSRERANLFRESDRFVMTRKDKWQSDEWVDSPDGARLLLRAVKSPVLSASGNCIGIVGIARDITDRQANQT